MKQTIAQFRRVLVACAVAGLAAMMPPTTVAAQSIVTSVNAGAAPLDEYWTAGSVGWFFTPSTSFSLLGVNTQFFATGGTDRTVTIELLSAPRFDGGTLLTSGAFNTATARGMFGGATFSSSYNLIANTQYFIGFRNMAPPGAGDFSLVPETELLRVNYTGDVGATALSALRFDFDDTGLYEFELDVGTTTQPLLQFVGVNPVAVVPEPATLALVGAGLMVVVLATRRRT